MPKVQLAIVEEETLVREGLRCLFGNRAEFEVVATAPTLAELGSFDRHKPSIVLLGIGRYLLPDWERISQFASAEGDSLRFVMLDTVVRDFSLRQVLRRALYGYVTRDDSFAEIRTVAAGVARGERAFSARARARMQVTPAGWRIRDEAESPGLHLLTSRETEILSLIGEGHNSSACAELLRLAPSTVDNHKAKIMKKLKVRRVVELVRFAIGEGLVPGYGLRDANIPETAFGMRDQA